jgi:hypothetical protein
MELAWTADTDGAARFDVLIAVDMNIGLTLRSLGFAGFQHLRIFGMPYGWLSLHVCALR